MFEITRSSLICQYGSDCSASANGVFSVHRPARRLRAAVPTAADTQALAENSRNAAAYTGMGSTIKASSDCRSTSL